MSKSDIQSWLSSASTERDESESTGLPWQRDMVLKDWSTSMEHAQHRLLESKTSFRVRFLQEELLPLVRHAELSLSQNLDIFKLLTLTYPRYADSISKDAVEMVGTEMIKRDELRGTMDSDEQRLGVTEQILGWLSHEVARYSKLSSSSACAPSDLFTLLSWCCGIYTICIQYNSTFSETQSWSVLLGSMALLLDMISDSSRAKESLKHAALVHTRRAFRSAGGKLGLVVGALLRQAKATQHPQRLIPLIGVAIGVLVRLRNIPESPSSRLSGAVKSHILTLYSSSLLMSKHAVPAHVLDATYDFIHHFVTEVDFANTLWPACEKAALRSPEYSLNVIRHFFTAYSCPLSDDSVRCVITQAVNCSKLSNAAVRTNSIQLFKTIVGTHQTPSILETTVNELLTLPQTGKTIGPDHRIALYTMLASIPACAVSAYVVQTTTPLLAKESHDAAVSALAYALHPHILHLLQSDLPLREDTLSLIAKEMNSLKPPIRRAFCALAGNVLWSSETLDTPAWLAFAAAVLPSFESSLKTVSNNLNAGAFEGYIAVAVLLGPLAQAGKFDESVARNPVIQAITSSSAKPSFLLSERVYQKLTDSEDELWLLRAIEAVIRFFSQEISTNDAIRLQVGNVFLHLSVNGSADIRRDVNRAIELSASKFPELTSHLVRDALVAFTARGPPSVAKVDNVLVPWNKHSRLAALLLSSVASPADCGVSVKEREVVEALIVAHHELICAPARQTWIDLCQRAGTDPHDLVNSHVDRLLYLVSINAFSEAFGFKEASYRAVTTLAFVCPESAVPRIVDQVREDIDANAINGLSEDDLGIWATPEGITYVDVLSSSSKTVETRKGKDADIARWEADLRKSLANKKTATPTLTKQQQALVSAQLEKESLVRRHVQSVKINLERGLHFVRSLVRAGVPQFSAYISSVVTLLLDGGGSHLVGQITVNIYLELAQCCSERLDMFRKWVGVATLRGLKGSIVPEELQAEALNSLVTRVLHRLRYLSEQSPFDPATFSYVFPLIRHVLAHGGVCTEDVEEREEQLALALDTIKFHCGEFADLDYPRQQTLEILILTTRQQPKLSKEASSALIDLSEAIYRTASKSEVDILLQGTLLQEAYVRNSCLQSLQPFDLTDSDWSLELWIACHDDDEQNSFLAKHVWEDNGLDVPETFLGALLPYLNHDHAYVRSSTAAAIAEAVEPWPQSIKDTVIALQEYYREKAKILAPEYDQYGMVIAQSLDRSDPWPSRVATARAFELLASSFTKAEVEPFFKFLIQDEALGDREPDVRRGMLSAGTTIIDLHGASCISSLIAMFEGHLSSPSLSTEAGDHIKEAVVILFGRVARHLDRADLRIPKIVDRLIGALKTPAEQVQIAVSDCLSPLVRLMRPKLPFLVDSLIEDLANASKYAARRGAAYGLAGVIKGTGIAGMKEFNVISRLRAATEDKKRYEPRQGTMFAFETLSSSLGRLFEPYITYVLPLLLSLFGDAIPDVREATQDAARVIMANMSGYGVKLILPSLLSGLDEKQWRTKKGSIELLGMMAYCSPRQLSLSLPIVIPRLTGVLTDSHTQVRTAANKSLKQFGEVISNPEIQSLVPVLLKALVDPAKTPNALSSLLKTSFMHYIDHSSLALVVPILERGLRERGADTKKKAVQIVGNLASLTDSRDFVPYLSELLPMVHMVLVDPVPEARATAAKALGTLVERLGEGHFPDLVPGLLRTLKTDTSGVDRQGAAQGLSEVLSGLGMERLEGLLPDIIANAQSPRATVREGFMSLLVYLPATFGTRFQPHLPKIITPILSGLSDVEEYVRDAAMRAGRMIITNYSNRAIDLLLPELEHGMFDPGWRIRQSSITLVGELLFKVSGISGKTSNLDEEDVADASTAESSRRALVEVLGVERRDRLLATLYLVRQDGVAVVRQSSIQIWKALVNNTPRTVRDILPELISQTIVLISSDEFEQQETSGRTIAELCRKFGEKIVGEIMAILKVKVTSTDSRTREGVCLVLSEIMENSTASQREDHEDGIISMVRVSLVDDQANVRSAAAKAFDMLQEYMGPKAIDETIPTLLEALRQPGESSGTALQALKEVMNVRAATVFPVLIPTLTATPMTVFNAHALASLVTVAGNALSKRLTVITSAFVKVIEDEKDEELLSAADEATRALFRSINDVEGLNTLMMVLLGWSKHDTPRRRKSAYKFFSIFCEETELDTSLYRVDWIRQLISAMEDHYEDVYASAVQTIDVFLRSVPKDELESLVVPLRRSIESTGAPGHFVPGFSVPKAVAPLVPVIIAGLTTGSNEQREQAAYAIGNLVERTEATAIKPYVVSFTGPLIRVATQATTYPPAVKTAILSALTSMLERIPAFVKPFYPQLQRTFVKGMSDPASIVVRNKAAKALGVLMKSQPRVDPVVAELIAGAKSNFDDGIGSSAVVALTHVVRSAKENVGEKAREACVDLAIDAYRGSSDESYIQAIASLVAALAIFPDILQPVVESYLVAGTPASVISSQTLRAVLSADEEEEDGGEGENLFQKLGLMRSVAQKVIESAGNEKPSIARPAREAREALRRVDDENLQGLL
ncbi:ARM repeat-containing protein [Guyanagaster necrorhizus]|uniref:ARM repeat-containing protein n=1 Tax=Guyanagaster necrorhizus TaxID=856835 RepID=A0A9P7VJE3_9AGAR|nr:ARM repeat-containing protein [Guyanagaster necrorhizus MCA 3950]KAG7441044.1 ARM repeat-containing protein [Guyanagaster necrorhizus MCA 3950]